VIEMQQTETKKKKKPGFIRRWTWRLMKTVFVLVLVGAPVVWFGAPYLAKTGWARAKAEAALTRTAGTPVHLDSLQLAWKSGFTATNVRGETVTRGRLEITPTIKEVRFAPKAATIFSSPKAKLTLVEPVIALRERATDPESPAAWTPQAPTPCSAKKGARFDDFVVKDGRVTYESEALNQPVTLENLNLRAEIQIRAGRVNVELKELTGRLNNGTVSASGVLAIEPGAASGKLDLEAADVTANDVLARVMRYLVPIFETAAPGEVKGRVNLKLQLDGKADDVQGLLRKAAGRGSLVFSGELSGTRLMNAFAARFDDPSLAQVPFDGVEGRLQFADGRVRHVNSQVICPIGSMSINGSTACDGLDLIVRLDPNLVMGRNGRAEESLRLLCEQGGVVVKGTLAQPVIE
jgi:uncharacterized protein involved in outer membrane biogenesis